MEQSNVKQHEEPPSTTGWLCGQQWATTAFSHCVAGWETSLLLAVSPTAPSSSPSLPFGLLTLFFLIRERSLHMMARSKNCKPKELVFAAAFSKFPPDP